MVTLVVTMASPWLTAGNAGGRRAGGNEKNDELALARVHGSNGECQYSVCPSNGRVRTSVYTNGGKGCLLPTAAGRGYCAPWVKVWFCPVTKIHQLSQPNLTEFQNGFLAHEDALKLLDSRLLQHRHSEVQSLLEDCASSFSDTGQSWFFLENFAVMK